MKYTEFVKANYAKVSHLPAKERMAELGKMWKKSGHASNASGKAVAGGMFMKRKGKGQAKKSLKSIKGKGIFSDILGGIGLGVEPKKRGRKPKAMAKGKGVVGGEVAGSGIFSDILGGIGLGVEPKKRGRNPKAMAKGKGVAGGEVAGGGIFSDILGGIGLGMPDKEKVKIFNKKVALEKKFHANGKLTPSEHNRLKVYQTLHGSGFFDSLWSGIKKGVSTVASVVPKAINTIGQVAQVVPAVAKFIPQVGQLAPMLSNLAPFAAMAL